MPGQGLCSEGKKGDERCPCSFSNPSLVSWLDFFQAAEHRLCVLALVAAGSSVLEDQTTTPSPKHTSPCEPCALAASFPRVYLAEKNNQSQAPFWGGFPMCLRQRVARLRTTEFILVAKVWGAHASNSGVLLQQSGLEFSLSSAFWGCLSC